jgi:site-specific recombinase XerD
MSVFKLYRGKRITSKHAKYAEARWWVYKRVKGHKTIHQSIPEARTKEQAENAERMLVQRLYDRRFGVSEASPAFAAFANGTYKRYCEQHNVNITAKLQYIGILIDHFKRTPLADITPQDCRDCQASLRRTHLSDSSVNRITSTLSKLFTVACQEGILDRNPMQFVGYLKEPPPRNRLLTNEQREKLWTELENDTLMLRLVSLATKMPLRRGQLLAITPAAIDFANGLIFVIASKGRPARLLPLNATARATLTAMLADGQLPFPLKDIRKRWSKMLVAAGINKKGGPRGTNFTFHDLRHEMASELMRNNVNPEIVRKLYGHSDMSITQVYMNADLDTLSGALRTLDATNVQPNDENGSYVH